MSVDRIDCATCAIDETRPFLARLPGAPRHLVECRRCGLIYTNPRPTPARVSQFFTDRYIPDRRKLERELGSYRAASLAREAALVQALVPEGRILDVGCAGGNFLAHFPASRWERHGVEPSPLAAAAAEATGVRVYPGLLGEATIPAETGFDVATCLDVLCLSATPAADLRRLHALLKPGGRLVIDLPGFLFRIGRNFGPLCWLINRRWSNFHQQSPHLYLFSPTSLERMLNQAGFVIEAIHPEYAPTRGSALARQLNRVHYLVSKLIAAWSGNRVMLAAKLVYVCRRI
jgi:SAM-dependent methyltransferase